MMRRLCLCLALSAATAMGLAISPAPCGSQAQPPYTLCAATVGTAYSFTFTAQGGTGPFTWSINSGTGSPPAWATLTASGAGAGTFSGVPTAAGSFSFVVVVTDSTGATASAQFLLTVNPTPLAITTISPLFSGTVGVAYSQTFQAVGGTQPYTWTITSGSAGPLTLNPNTGALTGTPAAQGALNFTVQVKDSSTPVQTVSAPFSIAIDYPPLVITNASLQPANLGVPYSQSLTASGGLPPYSWSIVSGAVPGISIDPSSGVLSGTPATVGVYSTKIQVTDSATAPQHATSRTFSITVNPPALTITTQSPLVGGTAGVAYSQPIAAVGGAPPYTWSATGLPAGLTIDPNSGTISGTPAAAGTFQVPVTVTDSNRNVTVQLFSITFALPPPPSVSLGGVPSSAGLASQVQGVVVSISQPYSGDITGQVSLSFSPSQQGANDATIGFSTGGTTANFTIPAGQTSIATPLAFQTGTLPGTITVSVSQLVAYTVNVTPSTPPSQNVTLKTSAPVITSAQLSGSGQTISVQVVGYTPTREASQAVFTFAASGNNQLQTSQFTVQTGSAFSAWFASSNASNANLYGSLFTYTQVFNVTGDPTGVTLQSVSLTNQQGTTQFTAH